MKIIKPQIHSGKKYVKIFPNDSDLKKVSIQVHKMVAKLFVENPENLRHIAFVDGNFMNTNYKNLEWSPTKTKFDEIVDWYPLKEFEENYEISILGIRNIQAGNILKFSRNNEGDKYPNAKLHYKGKSFCIDVHVLMAKQFIPNPNNLPCVNHKDGNKKNWKVENLEWVTFSENNKHAYTSGLRNASKGKSLTVHEIDKNGKIIQTFNSIKEMAIAVSIDKCVAGKRIQQNEMINGRKFIFHKFPEIEQKWINVNTPHDEINEAYQISNLGNVRLIKTGRILENFINNGGYKVATLRAGDIEMPFKISRLMAFSFTGSKRFEHDVNHKNKNKTDDRLENLEILEKTEHNRRDLGKAVVGFHKDTGKPIAFRSLAEAAIEMKLKNYGCISAAMKRAGTSAGHYWFEAKSENVEKLLDAAGLILFIDEDTLIPTIIKKI